MLLGQGWRCSWGWSWRCPRAAAGDAPGLGLEMFPGPRLEMSQGWSCSWAGAGDAPGAEIGAGNAPGLGLEMSQGWRCPRGRCWRRPGPAPGRGPRRPPRVAARCQGKPGEKSPAGRAAPLSDALVRFSASSGAILKLKGLRSPPDTRYPESKVLREVKLGVCW